MSPRRLLLVLAVLALGLTAAVAAPAAASTAPAASAGGWFWAVPHRACSAPKRGEARCFAVSWTAATRTTRGARRFAASALGSGPKGGYSPADLARAYGYSRTATAAATQTVAIVDAYHDPQARAELNAFDKAYGFPAETSTSFRQVNQSGVAGSYPAASASWSQEIALDIETVRAVCSRCRILLVEARGPNGTDLAAAVNTAARLGATEISNSYGISEIFTDPTTTAGAYDHPGVVITASTGDDGLYDWDFANDLNNPANDMPDSDGAAQVPSTYKTVVAVGGTTLTANATTRTETVWNNDGPLDASGVDSSGTWTGDQGATGGGCSTVYPAPDWQATAAGYEHTGCKGARLAADVAADADPSTGVSVYSTYAGGWHVFGGTSLASPLVAAMWALAGGSGGAAYPAQSLYDHLRWTPGSLNDVIAGGNGFCGGGSAADCSARVRALTDKTALPATQVGTLGGVATGNPNNITNGNQDWGTQGWVGPVDCSFAYPTYDANTDTYTAAGEDINPDSTECNAAVGFDGPSGVGSPHGLSAFTRMGPTVTIGAPSLLKVKTTATFRVASFSDNIPNTSAARYKWTWGDGTSTTTTALSAAHAFAKAGTYRITLTVRDTQDRLYSVAKTYRLGYAPTVAITGPSTVKRYVKNTWRAAVTEPNTGGRVTSYAWHISGSTALYSRSSSLTASFHAGTHYVSVTVTDDSGFHATKSFKITTT